MIERRGEIVQSELSFILETVFEILDIHFKCSCNLVPFISFYQS